jgi:hypothetical protein
MIDALIKRVSVTYKSYLCKDFIHKVITKYIVGMM